MFPSTAELCSEHINNYYEFSNMYCNNNNYNKKALRHEMQITKFIVPLQYKNALYSLTVC